MSLRACFSAAWFLAALGATCAGADPAPGAPSEFFDAVRRGDAARVRALLDSGRHTPNIAIPNLGEAAILMLREGATPLWIACERGYADVAQVLLDKGARIDATDVDGVSCLQIAVRRRRPQVVELLLARADVNHKDKYKSEELFYAVATDDKRLAESVLAKGAIAPTSGWTLVHAAATLGRLEMLKWLFDKGLDKGVDTTATERGETALHLVAREPRMKDAQEIVELLLARGAPINAQDRFGWTALMTACVAGNEQVVRVLLANKADLELADSQDQGRAEIEMRIPPERRPIRPRKTALYLALWNGHDKIVSLLAAAGAQADVFAAAGLGRKQTVAELAQTQPRVLKAAPSEGSLLHFAARSGNREMVDYLLENGADVMSRDREKRTPLHFAATRAAAEALIAKGAEVDALDQDRARPLHAALKSGRLDVARLLIERGAQVRPSEKSPVAPLCTAAERGEVPAIELLVAKGAPLTEPGNNALSQAVEFSRPAAAEWLISHGADINAGGDRAPLKLAMRRKDRGLIDLLLRHGASPADNESLIAAARAGDMELVKLALSKGADVNGTAPGYDTPLHAAAEQGNRPLVELLLARGADPNRMSTFGKRTPALMAFDAGHRELGRFLESKEKK